MAHTNQTVRQLVQQRLDELGFTDAKLGAQVCLLRDGHIVAWRYETEAAQAVWLFAEQVVKLFDYEGNLLDTIELADGQEQRKAA